MPAPECVEPATAIMSGFASTNSRRNTVNPWVWLSAAVALVDLAAIARKRPTLSAAFRGAVRHPVRRWPVLAATGIVLSHLTFGRP